MCGLLTLPWLVIGQEAGSRPASEESRGQRGARARVNPQRRQALQDRVLSRYLERLSEAYGLTEEQKPKVRQKLEDLADEARSKRDADNAGSMQMIREIGEMRAQRRRGENVDPQRQEEIREKLRQRWHDSPLSLERVSKEIEPLVSPEQAARGREKLGRMMADFRRGAQSDERWLRFVEGFARHHQFDATQKATADSLLRDAVQQRDLYEKAHAADYEAAAKIEDVRARQKKLAELNKPIGAMFETLREKLNQLPTADQREKAKGSMRRAATRPAQ